MFRVSLVIALFSNVLSFNRKVKKKFMSLVIYISRYSPINLYKEIVIF